MAKKSKSQPQEVDADMTPMIDVTFQLIIFFICTIKFKTLEGKLETQLPKDVGVNPTPLDELMEKLDAMLVKDTGHPEGFFVTLSGQRQGSLAAFRQRLADIKRVTPDTKITLHPQRGITYAHVVQVVDECIRAEVFDITFGGVAFDA